MKDPHSVLREKEQDLERVHEEIQALLTVIPLLADEQPSSDVMHELLLAFPRTPVDPANNDMAQLELITPSSGTCECPSAQSGDGPPRRIGPETP
jgi:hypothetical protein